MGRRPQLRFPRTAAACLLTLVAVAVPCAAWFVTGSREIAGAARAQQKIIYDKAGKKAVVLAERLATRLEVLREVESRRPFYHYQNLYHDPRGAAEGVSVFPSPLAQGPDDPLIDAHFQVDDTGELSLPTLNDEFPELGLHSGRDEQCALFGQLKDVAFFCTLEAADTSIVQRRYEPRGSDEAEVAGERRPQSRFEVLDGRAWEQHLLANVLYADLKYGKKHGGAPLGAGLASGSGGPQVEIVVSPFSWYTLPVGEEPSLVALRAVETPAGVWTQGFVISRRELASSLESSFPAVSARFADLEREHGESAVLEPIGGTPWGIALDVSEPLAEEVGRVARERERFLSTFLAGGAAAGIAGLLVLAMVFQSERLAQQRAQFAAAAAHELRTPLAGLRLYGEMLAEGLGDPQRSRDYARRMAGEAERLGRVVTNVLSFTRLEREAIITLHPEPGDLAEAVSEALKRQRPALEESGAAVDLEVARDLPTVAFDRDAVGHILQNLLDNAEKYTRDVDGRRISVRLVAEVRRVALSVADNGRGISRQLRRRLFQPFARGGQSDAPEGLGLGLVLVKALARAQGGDIRYRDAPGGGAMFTVTFPV